LTRRCAALLGRSLLGAGSASNLSNDAHLAALVIELGSFDRDFQRFAGLSFEWLTADVAAAIRDRGGR